jgi:hypothetical protein
MKFDDLDLPSVGHEILLVGGIWAGKGAAYLCYFPEFSTEVGPLQGTVVLEMGYEEWKRLLRQSDLVETEVLAKAKDGKLYKAVARKCERNISQGISWNVWRRDDFECRYCAADDVPMTVDHVVLWEEGGPSIEENLVTACRKCNKKRGNTPYAEWLESPYYKEVSRVLTPSERETNRALLDTLDAIPRMVHKRSHR